MIRRAAETGVTDLVRDPADRTCEGAGVLGRFSLQAVRHICRWLEVEDLENQLGRGDRLTHVRAHLAAGDALDGIEKRAEHRLLKRRPGLAHGIELTSFDQRSLDGQKRITKPGHEQLVVHLRLLVGT